MGLEKHELGYATVGGMLAGAGIAAGVHTGFFSNIGQSIAGLNVPGVLDANIGYAERIFQGVKPFVDGGLNVVQATGFEVGPVQAMQTVDNLGLGASDYGASYQASPHQGLDPVKRRMFETGDAFWNDPVTQGALELGSWALPTGKVLGMAGKLIGRGIAKGANLGRTTIFRSVSFNELYDIQARGFQLGSDYGSKLFANSFDDAARFGKNNFVRYGGGPNTIVGVNVPTHLYNKLYSFPVDGMNAVSAHPNLLKQINRVGRIKTYKYSPYIR